MKPHRFAKYFQNKFLLIYVGFILLAMVTFATAWYTNLINVTNADHLIYPYLFQHFQVHNIIVPMQHSNILKYPLFIVQSVLPYNRFSVSVVNIGLTLITVLAWYSLSLVVSRGRHAVIMSLIFSCILLGSPLLSHEILGTTIRNIEFPIALAFFISLRVILRRKAVTRATIAAIVVSSLLFSITVASDAFFLYTASVSAILLILIEFFIRGELPSRAYRAVLGLVVVASGVGLLIRIIVGKLGVVELYDDPTFSARTLPIDHIGPSLGVASEQVLNLFGANIFGKNIGIGLLLPFFNMIILSVTVVGAFVAIATFVRNVYMNRKKTVLADNFVPLTISLMFFLAFTVYVLSDLVVRVLPSGAFASAYQDRYVTFLAFTPIIVIPYILNKIRKRHIEKTLLIGLALVIVVSLHGSLQSYRHESISAATFDATLSSLRSAIKKEGVSVIVSGYWYAAPTKLVTGDPLSIAPIGSCNVPSPRFNVDKSWYSPASAPLRSALLVDRTGPDKQYWNCSNERLDTYYGTPYKTIRVTNGVELRIYEYDIRNKLQDRP